MIFISVQSIRFFILLCCISLTGSLVVTGEEADLPIDDENKEVEMVDEMVGEIDEEDFYDLVGQAAESEVAAADDVLAEDERYYGKRWLTMKRLIFCAVLLAVFQILMSLWVYRNGRRRELGKMAAVWALIVLVTSIPGIFLYGILTGCCRKQLKGN